MSTPHLSPTELMEQYGDDELTGQKAKIPFKRIQLLHGLIVGSEIPDRITQWRHAAKAAPGGRPAKIDDTTVLVVMLALALEGSPLLITRMATVLAERLGPKSKRLLGIFGTAGTHAQWYDRVHRCMQSMYAVMDPKPGPRRRRLTTGQVKEILAARDESESQTKTERLDWVANELIHLSVLLAGGQMDNWHGNMSIDATVFGVFNTRGGSRDSDKTPAKDTDRAPLEYDAWWYFRNAQWGTTGKNYIKRVFGYEAHLIAASTNAGDIREDNFPTLILGLSVERPGHDVAGLSMRAFNQVDKRHHDRIQGALVIGDRGYFAATQADKLQLPLRALGLGIVTDYKVDQLGVQAGYAGAELIEGNWYCPSMPENLKNATVLYRADEIDWQTWKNWIASRKKYLLRRHEKKSTPHGATKMKCPAAGPNPTVTCPLKELGCSASTDHLKEIKERDLPLYPDRVCTNGTVTFPATAGAKFRQELQFASPEWDRMYGAARNTIEAANAHLKDDSHEGLAAAGRRRVRGYTAQYLMIAVLVFASNLRRIETHRKRVTADEQARDPRRFAETSIQDYAPKPPEWWKTGAQRFRRQKAA